MIAKNINSDSQSDQKLVGIRGWLIFPAIRFVISPLTIFYLLYKIWSFIRMMDLDTGFFSILEIILYIVIPFYIFLIVLLSFRKQQNVKQVHIYFVAFELIAPTLILFLLALSLLIQLKYHEEITLSDYMIYTVQEVILLSVVLFYTFIAALRFFKKSRYAPQTCVRFMVFEYFASLLLLILRHVFIGGVDPFVPLQIAYSISFGIPIAIWILYFRVSKRVKATFINQEDNFGLPYKIAMPIRYFTHKRISWLAFSAVALCVFIVVVVMTVMTGLVNDFKQRNYRFVGDCVVGTDSLVGFAYYEDFVTILEKQNYIEAVSPVIKSFALVRPRGTEQDDAVEIMGIDPVKHSLVTDFTNTLSYHKDSISKAFNLAHDPNLTGCIPGGDWLRVRGFFGGEADIVRLSFSISCFPLTSRGALAQAATDLVDTKNFYSSDKSDSDLPRVDSALFYLPFGEAQRLCGMGGPIKRVSWIHIKFTRDMELQRGCENVRSLWSEYSSEKSGERQAYLLDTVSVQSWKQFRRETIAPMEQEEAVMGVMFVFVGITTVFIILVVFYMIISHKSKDIGILKSVGASNADIIQLFSGFAFLVGLLGSIIGLFAGWLFLLNINRIEDWLFENYRFQLWDRSMYAIGDIPNQVEIRVLLIIAISAIIACLIGAFIPSRQAAKRKIVDTLQVTQL